MKSRPCDNEHRRRSQRGPRVHLECWFWAGVFFSALIVIAFLKLDPSVTPTDEFVVFNGARLDVLDEHPARYKVVLLGDSRLKYATLSDDDLGRLAADLNADIAFLRIVQNQAQFDDFVSFLDRILAIEPDLVLLQESLFSRQRDEDVDLRTLQKMVIWSLVDGRGTWNPHGVNQAELQFATPCLGSGAQSPAADMNPAQLHAFVEEVHDRGTREWDGPNALAARAFVEVAGQRGIRVLPLELPATDAYSRILETAFADHAETAGTTLRATWKCPRRFQPEDYCDLMHLDADARTMFSEWLTRRAVDQLQAVEPRARMASVNDAEGHRRD